MAAFLQRVTNQHRCYCYEPKKSQAIHSAILADDNRDVKSKLYLVLQDLHNFFLVSP